MIAGRHANTVYKAWPVHEYLATLDKTSLWHLQQLYKHDFQLFGYKPHFNVTNDPTQF